MPKNNEAYYELVRDVRPNKGTILKSSVDYIKCLKHEINRLRRTELKQKDMEQQNKRLMMRVQVKITRSTYRLIIDVSLFKELELQSRRETMEQSTSNGSWASFASSGASSTHQHQNEFANGKVRFLDKLRPSVC